MNGFAAVSAANGWLITVVGISIVFLGLASLAFIISLFPHLIGRLDARTPKSLVLSFKDLFYPVSKKPAPVALVAEETPEEGELDGAEESLRLLTAHMGEPFKLPRLLEVAERRGLVKTHSTICRLILRSRLVGGPDGLFRWGDGH